MPSLYLSLPLNDSKSVYDQLQKQLEGEEISGFKCEDCEKTVDIRKRSLLTQTPNVLIVHLQRIAFSFETYENDKLNNYIEFPEILDLKPYTYQEVMRREGKDKNREKTAAELEEEQKLQIDDPDKLKKRQEEDDAQEPTCDEDCYEYKLVGVNVHSGTANAGHYWSYINTVRGMEEKDSNNPEWANTDKDEWMEFNDSTVKKFKYEELKD